jgi:hypothetical protein
MGDFREHGDDHSGSTKQRNFLQLSNFSDKHLTVNIKKLFLVSGTLLKPASDK